MEKRTGFEGIPVLKTCLHLLLAVTLGKLLNPSKLLFAHLQNVGSDSTYFRGLVRGPNNLLLAKLSAEY